MRTSEINFTIKLDQDNIPENIEWNATDKPGDGPDQTKAIAVSVWDDERKNTLRIDLWSKEMVVEDMKKMAIDTIGGISETIRNATKDEKMASMMHEFCQELIKHVQEDIKKKQ